MIEKLGAFFRGDMDDSPDVLKSHSRDASLFEMRPKVVVYPKDADDVSKLVQFVVAEKKTDPTISITARSAGTCMAGGSLTNSISLDGTRFLNHLGPVKKVQPYAFLPHFYGVKKPVLIHGEIDIEPGVYYRDLEKATLADNLLLPCFTASKGINALGGMIGNNSGGELSLKYGKTQDYVKSVSVVLADGTKETFSEIPRAEAEERAKQTTFVGSIYRGVLSLVDTYRELIEAKRPHVSKNSAGYNLWNVSRKDPSGNETIDLSQLIVGSQGTLAITTGATMRLVENVEDEKHSALLVVFLSNLDKLGDIVDEILTVDPEAVEAYDDKTIKLAIRFWRGFIKKQGLWGAIKLGVRFLPEFKMLLGGMPRLVLLVEAASDNKLHAVESLYNLEKKLQKFTHIKTHLVRSHDAGEKYWTIRRDSFALLREHFQGKRTAPFIDDVIVPPEKLPSFIPAIGQILEAHKLSYNIHGHAGNGNFHLIPLIGVDARLSNQMILDVSKEVYDLVLKYGGSITAEHNDGIIRTPYLLDMFGKEMTDLFAQVKKIFDPQNIFNPGKKVGFTKEDIGKYLISGK